MNIQPIHTDDDLERAFARLEELWDAEEGSAA
jgi:HTH-type transcriptional regulator/antitoxin HigA